MKTTREAKVSELLYEQKVWLNAFSPRNGTVRLAMVRELGDKLGIAISLEGLAGVVAALGSSLRAARIWGAAERLRAQTGSPLSPRDRPDYERRATAARTALGDDAAFDRARQEGGALTLEQAIEIALEETVERPPAP